MYYALVFSVFVKNATRAEVRESLDFVFSYDDDDLGKQCRKYRFVTSYVETSYVVTSYVETSYAIICRNCKSPYRGTSAHKHSD